MNDTESQSLSRRLNQLGSYDPEGKLKSTRIRHFVIGLAAVAISSTGAFFLGVSQREAPQIDPAGLSWLVDQVSAHNGVLNEIAEAEIKEKLGL